MAKSKQLPVYPKDHKVGMAVPNGGSNCAKCEYVRGQNCAQELFIQWNGGKRIPGAIEAYCCDFFEAGAKDTKFEDVGL